MRGFDLSSAPRYSCGLLPSHPVFLAQTRRSATLSEVAAADGHSLLIRNHFRIRDTSRLSWEAASWRCRSRRGGACLVQHCRPEFGVDFVCRPPLHRIVPATEVAAPAPNRTIDSRALAGDRWQRRVAFRSI